MSRQRNERSDATDSSIRNLALTVLCTPPLVCGNAAARCDWPTRGRGGPGAWLARGCRESLVLHEFN